jgi:hypothetical protein
MSGSSPGSAASRSKTGFAEFQPRHLALARSRIVLPSMLRRLILLTVLTALIGVATISVWIPAFIYRPTPLTRPDPAAWGLPSARIVRIPSGPSDRLFAWWVPPPRKSAPVAHYPWPISKRFDARACRGQASYRRIWRPLVRLSRLWPQYRTLERGQPGCGLKSGLRLASAVGRAAQPDRRDRSVPGRCPRRPAECVTAC